MNIWIAASDGKMDLVEKFLHGNPNLSANSPDPNGYTPIHAAAAYGHIDLLRKLCNQYKGDINVRDADGDTPLHHCEDVNTAKVIIEELGGDFSLTNSEGKTAVQVFEEDAEFPELIEYMRLKSGIPLQLDSFGIDKNELAQFKDNVRYSIENEEAGELDEESLARRKRLEEIMQGDNVDQELEKYVREMLTSAQMMPENDRNMGDEPSSKRRR